MTLVGPRSFYVGPAIYNFHMTAMLFGPEDIRKRVRVKTDTRPTLTTPPGTARG